MFFMYQILKDLIFRLRKLLIIYDDLVFHAPTEEIKKIVFANRNTVLSSSEVISKIYKNTFGKNIENLEQEKENIRESPDFFVAARSAFHEEIMIIEMLKNLYLQTDTFDKNANFSCLIEHQINAINLLYLL